jgi:excisionase family DNA binding protein
VESSSVLIDIETVAEMLQVSSRTVRRLTDAGRAPAPRKLGSLIRYSRADIESWVAGGCKPVRRP